MSIMARVLCAKDLDEFTLLIQQYIMHISQPQITIEKFKKQLQNSIETGLRYVLGAYDENNKPLGLLIHDPKFNRISLIFANSDFSVEKELFDKMFGEFSEISPTITFDSGYPIPWISLEFSEYAISSGFMKHDRCFMMLQRPKSMDHHDLPDNFHLIPFSESEIEDVTKMVFQSVDGSIDQNLFPFVYESFDTTLRFHQQIIAGDFGIHKPSYSWILKKGDDCIGACFMTTSEEHIGHLMHLAIAPDFRRRGLGKNLLLHSLHNLFTIEPNLVKVDLTVTLSNPVRNLYVSIGFKRVNDMSTFVWKKRNQ
ncbi:MAG: GNAT family N-acetyltransferase [Candidatus Sifarchaeia archaeon]